MEYYDLTNTGPEVQERLDLVPITKADLDQEVLDRIEGDQRVLAESRAYCDIETARAMQVEANLQAQIDAIVGSRLTITVSKDVGIIYVGVPTTINFVIGTSMDVTSCKLMRGDVEVASSDVPGSNFAFADTLTVASDIGRVSYSVIAVLGGIERIQPVEIPVEKQTPAFAWNPADDVTVTEGQYTPSDFPTLVNVPTGLTVVCSSSNPAVATVNSSGVVTVIGVGECTIKAESQATDVYKSKSVAYKLTIQQQVFDIYWEAGKEGSIAEVTSFDYLTTEVFNTIVRFKRPEGTQVDYKVQRTSPNPQSSFHDLDGGAFRLERGADYDVIKVPGGTAYPGSPQNNSYSLRAIANVTNYDLRLVTKRPFPAWDMQGDTFVIGRINEGVINPDLLPKVLGDPNDYVNMRYNSYPVEGQTESDRCAVIDNNSQYSVKAVKPGRARISVSNNGLNYVYYGSASYTLVINNVGPEEFNYYVGWSKGTSFDDFAAMTAEQLVALSESYNKTVTPSTTKTVTAADVSNVTREIFILMWKDGSAPTGGSMTSGGFTETFSAQDFLDTNIFNATHADVVIDGETFHVVGMRGNFGAGDSFTVRFN